MPLKTIRIAGVKYDLPQRTSYACSCGRSTDLVCDWPDGAGGTCGKSVCTHCRRQHGDKDYCPFHRGDPPLTADEAAAAGEAEARKLAKMFGIERG